LRSNSSESLLPRRLFPRQLLSFALACILQNITYAPIMWVNLGLQGKHVGHSLVQNSHYCKWSYTFFCTARFITLNQEMHIATTFLVQPFRMTKTLRALSSGLPVVWVLGIVLGIADAAAFPWSLDSKTDNIICNSDTNDYLSATWLTIAVVLWLTSSFLTCLWSSKESVPGSVKRKALRRASSYPLVALVSYLLVIVEYYSGNESLIGSRLYIQATCLLEVSNGFLVVFVYAFQKRQAAIYSDNRSPGGRNATGPSVRGVALTSLTAEFGGVDIVDLHPYAASSSLLESSSSSVSELSEAANDR